MYSTDIKDKEWLILFPFVAQGKMGRPRIDNIRQIINAIFVTL
jgi:putative transposase